MNNEFLRHLQSLTPEGKAAEKKLFIPADKFKAKEPENIDMGEVEEIDEATRSKFLKAKYAGDAEKTRMARMKREASILRRGGADQEVVRKELSHPTGKPRRMFSDYEMAKNKFYKRGGESMDRDERFRAVGKKPPRNVSEEIGLDEAILKGESARRSILLRKNKEAKQQAARFQDTMKWAGDAQTAALHTKPPEPSPTAKLRTRKTDKRGIEKSGSGDFSAAEKAAEHGKQDADFIMKVLHRKPDGTKVKIFGTGPRGKEKAVHVHKKTELGKPRFFHSASGKEVELTKGGVGMKVLDAKTKKVILDRGNDAIWESTINEAAPDVGQNLKGMPRRSARKLAYALKGWRNQNVSTDKFRVADNRQTRKMGSHAKRWGKKLDTALSDFSKRTGIPLKEGSLGMKKGIRITRAVVNKGHTDIGKRADAGLLRVISKINKEAGGTGRITTKPHRYQFSDAEQAVMQGHYRKSIAGKNRRRGINEGKAKKAYKKTKKVAKRVLKKLYTALSTPQDAVDVMYTGRIFQ